MHEEWHGIRHVTVTQRLDELAETRPDRLCYRMGSLQRTYAQCRERSFEVARQFRAVGAEKGSRVAVLAPNRSELLDLYFGLARLGAIQVPLNPFLKGEFLRHQLTDSQPHVVVTDPAGWVALEPLLTDVSSIHSVVLLDPLDESTRASVEVFNYDDMLESDFEDPETDAGSLMSIIYTSGTTGQPKGCMLTHGYYSRCGQIDAELMKLGEDDVFYTCLPLFHGGAQLKVIMTALMAGIPFVVDPAFSASGFFRSVAESGGTVASAVGAMGAMILATPPSEYDRAHRLRLLNVAPLAVHQQQAFMDRFGTDVWTETYGQTECVPILSADPFGTRDRATVGRAVRDLDVCLLDGNGTEVPDGTPGEICIRPRHRFAMFSGYWGNSQATMSQLEGLWYHTGDYGRRTPSGAIAFVDRKKDALRVRGENVSSVELETAIMTHPSIAEVAVHAISSELEEDDIKACIVLKDGAHFEPDTFFTWLGSSVPYFAVPRYVEVMDALPKNPVNRVLKHVLRDRGVTKSTWDFRALGMSIAKNARR